MIERPFPSHEEFTAALNASFQVQTQDGRKIDLRLIEVSEKKLKPRQIMYAITFLGPSDILFAQGLANFTHPQLGSFDLFIVPVGKSDEGYLYESVFNFLIEPQKTPQPTV